MLARESDQLVVPGRLLIAAPTLHDPNFDRAVILLCDHGIEGSFGLVLNRPVAVRTVNEDEELAEPLATVASRLGIGGPVERDTLHYLHRLGPLVSEAAEVADGLWWGGDFEEVQQLLTEHPPLAEDVRFFLGYAGWGAGQLSEEVGSDSWIIADPTEELVFDIEASRLWPSALRHMGGPYAYMANYPADPRLN